MPPLFFRPLRVILPVLFFVQTAQAQNLIQGTDVGIHVFGTRPNIQASESRMGTLVHAYLRRQLGERTQQELNIGMGLIQGVDFKTRILPVDYRVLAFPFPYSKGRLFPGLHYGDMYAYAGLGFVNSTPIEIPRPDDPLTVDAGRTLRSSEFLDLTTNWSVHLPVGIGTSIHLDDETQMVFNAGYQVSTTKGLDGYFAMSVGLKFSKPFRPRRAQSGSGYRFPVTTEALATIVSPVAKAPLPADTFEPFAVYFESSISRVEAPDLLALEDLARRLSRNPGKRVVLSAHADSSGNPEVNRVLAEDRSWQTAVALMRMGVDRERIRMESYGADQPAETNQRPEGRAKNRRLEIELHDSEPASGSEPIHLPVVTALDLPEGGMRTFADYTVETDVAPSQETVSVVLALAESMRRDPEIRIRITAYHDRLGSDATKRLLATAQASRIQRLLVEQGVDVGRIETVGVAGGPRRTELLRVAEAR
jgi:outer membrane protein OmpA-like peptidoglycan-associated protein